MRVIKNVAKEVSARAFHVIVADDAEAADMIVGTIRQLRPALTALHSPATSPEGAREVIIVDHKRTGEENAKQLRVSLGLSDAGNTFIFKFTIAGVEWPIYVAQQNETMKEAWRAAAAKVREMPIYHDGAVGMLSFVKIRDKSWPAEWTGRQTKVRSG